MHDGNLDDKTWNRQVMEDFERLLAGHPREQLIYVADSQFVTETNLMLAAKKGVRFISRLPATFALEAELKHRAWQAWQTGEGWVYVGTVAQRRDAEKYWVWETEAELYGRRYRFVVVRSTAQDRRKAQTLQRQVSEEAQRLAKACRELARRRFACEPDAQKAWARFEAEQAPVFHTLRAQIQPETKRRRPPGRPRRDAPPPAAETTWRIVPEVVAPTEAQLQRALEVQAPFVLITNVPRQELAAPDILMEYKRQPSVERRFAFLKDPVIVDGIYLKRPDRAYALGFVFLLALLVAAFLERRIRHELARTQDVLVIGGQRTTQAPTLQAILDLFRSLQVILVDTGQRVERVLPSNTNPQVLKVLRLAGYSEAICLRR